MAATSTSLLQTALQNLHVQQGRDPLRTPEASPSKRDSGRDSRPDSSPPDSGEDDDGDDLIQVGRGTRPTSPVLGQRTPSSRGRSRLSGPTKDPLRTLPTHLAVRVFLQLDIRSLARCDAVCKRWHKSSTMNYVWFLQNRALMLPQTLTSMANGNGKMRRTDSDTPDFFDPYDKTPRLAALPIPPMPTSTTPQWTKNESKKTWKTAFRQTLKRTDPNAEDEDDHLRVDIYSLHSSGAASPSRHAHVGTGSGGAAKWASSGDGSGSLTPSERKLAAREEYKALGGRKSRAKRKMGGELGARDKGGAVDDPRFEAPW